MSNLDLPSRRIIFPVINMKVVAFLGSGRGFRQSTPFRNEDSTVSYMTALRCPVLYFHAWTHCTISEIAPF